MSDTRIVFFDRDNTLIPNDGYLGDPHAVELVAGAAEAVGRLKRAGWSVVIVSNQSGVARGMFDEAAVNDVNDRLDALLREVDPDARVDLHLYCPHHPDAEDEAYRQTCACRKPQPGLLIDAARWLGGVDLTRCWLIGDTPRDVAAGKAVGCRTVLFTDPAFPASPAAGEEAAIEPDFRVKSLTAAADHVLADARPQEASASR